jgi:hypothetical protein
MESRKQSSANSAPYQLAQTTYAVPVVLPLHVILQPFGV